jgi:uncharacterized LabA/DUF88 family protein
VVPGFLFLEVQMTRVYAYVDGFNLYHSIDDAIKNSVQPKPHFSKYKWLDIHSLVQKFLVKDDRLDRIYYFSAIAEWNVDKAKRHKTYIEALQTTHVRIVLGKFINNERICLNCKSAAYSPIEKRTDVNISVRMIRHAFQDKYDKAVLISGDSDQIPTISCIKELYPKKIIYSVIPFNRKANEIKRIAHLHGHVDERKLKTSLFPDKIVLPNGREIFKPIEWA